MIFFSHQGFLHNTIKFAKKPGILEFYSLGKKNFENLKLENFEKKGKITNLEENT